MFPIEWIDITRAIHLSHGDLAYLPDLDMSLVLVGTINEFTVAVMLGADVSKCTTQSVENLSGPAFTVSGVRFEADIRSLEKLDIMDDRYEALVVCGKDVLIVARPPSNVGYVTIKVAELKEESSSQVPFAYRSWRLVKDHRDKVMELYRKD
jgi:hypothetical protein